MKMITQETLDLNLIAEYLLEEWYFITPVKSGAFYF